MDTNEARAFHLTETVRGAGFGEGFSVALFGEDVLFHHRRQQADGSWLATMKATVAWEPILIGEPEYVFVPARRDRYGEGRRTPVVPAPFAAEVEAIRSRLMRMRDEGLFETEEDRSARPGL